MTEQSTTVRSVEKHERCDRCNDDDQRCPECKALTHNNSACGDPECCGQNYDYCTECDWSGGY